MTIKLLASLALAVVFAVVGFGAGYLYFYQAGYDPPPAPDVPFDRLTSPKVLASPLVETSPASTTPGLFLVDALHMNAFAENEIVPLRSRVADRGYDVEFVGNFGPREEADRLLDLEDKLRRADSFLVISPRASYSAAEVDLVEVFVRKGGKLLLIADPTRQHVINSLAERFGLNFQPDYLYNQIDHDLNFQNIFVREFQPDELTAGLDAIVLYTAGSIRSSGPGLAFTDGDTRSSIVEAMGALHPIAWGDNRNVVAIADLTFLIPPHNSLLDNDRLVSNLADYFTEGSREFDLADFPNFFTGGPKFGLGNGVDILLGQPTLLNSGTQLKNGLSEFGITSDIRGVEDLSRDTVFLGLHSDAQQVGRYLQAAGIRVDETLGTPFSVDLDLEGTALTVLDRAQDRHVLIILADNAETLSGAVDRLLTGEFRNDLVSNLTGVSR